MIEDQPLLSSVNLRLWENQKRAKQREAPGKKTMEGAVPMRERRVKNPEATPLAER